VTNVKIFFKLYAWVFAQKLMFISIFWVTPTWLDISHASLISAFSYKLSETTLHMVTETDWPELESTFMMLLLIWRQSYKSSSVFKTYFIINTTFSGPDNYGLKLHIYTGVSESELVRIKFVRIVNHLRGVSVSEQFGYRDPSEYANNVS